MTWGPPSRSKRDGQTSERLFLLLCKNCILSARVLDKFFLTKVLSLSGGYTNMHGFSNVLGQVILLIHRKY